MPERYVVITSVAMNPMEKKRIVDALAPFCLGPQDVYAQADINGLLANHPDVEKQHIKLWLSGVPMLERLLHAEVFNLTAATVDSVRNELARIVVHEGVNEARKILEKHHHVVLVGLPGIGKTTVANLLLAERIYQGDEPICITNDIKEAWGVMTPAMHNPEHRLVIQYDDFLGQTALDAKFNKNEERSLGRLIETIRTLPNVRLIMTTRDYILEQAKNVYEVLARSEPEWAKCTVRLEHYDEAKRARILYQHLYFSDLPNSRLTALLQANAHLSIVRHKNFNPRIVATLCRHTATRTLNDREFVKSVLNKLDNPTAVWQRPFEDHLDEKARLLLMVLVSFPGAQAHKDDVQRGCYAASTAYRVTWGAVDLDRALRQTEGTFTILKWHGDSHYHRPHPIIAFHNPSIRDFLLEWLRNHPRDLQQLYRHLGAFRQALGLLNQRAHNGDQIFREALLPLNQEIVTSAWSLLDSQEHQIYSNTAVLSSSWRERVPALANALKDMGIPWGMELLLQLFKERWENYADIEEDLKIRLDGWFVSYWSLLQRSVEGDASASEKFRIHLAHWLERAMDKISDTSDAGTLASIWKAHEAELDGLIDAESFSEKLIDKFGDGLSTLSSDDYDGWSQAKDDNETLCNLLGYALSGWEENIEEGLNDALEQTPPDPDDRDEPSSWQTGEMNSVDSLFLTVTDGRE